jgi:hypothetical protein
MKGTLRFIKKIIIFYGLDSIISTRAWKRLQRCTKLALTSLRYTNRSNQSARQVTTVDKRTKRPGPINFTQTTSVAHMIEAGIVHFPRKFQYPKLHGRERLQTSAHGWIMDPRNKVALQVTPTKAGPSSALYMLIFCWKYAGNGRHCQLSLSVCPVRLLAGLTKWVYFFLFGFHETALLISIFS